MGLFNPINEKVFPRYVVFRCGEITRHEDVFIFLWTNLAQQVINIWDISTQAIYLCNGLVYGI